MAADPAHRSTLPGALPGGSDPVEHDWVDPATADAFAHAWELLASMHASPKRAALARRRAAQWSTTAVLQRERGVPDRPDPRVHLQLVPELDPASGGDTFPEPAVTQVEAEAEAELEPREEAPAEPDAEQPAVEVEAAADTIGTTSELAAVPQLPSAPADDVAAARPDVAPDAAPWERAPSDSAIADAASATQEPIHATQPEAPTGFRSWTPPSEEDVQAAATDARYVARPDESPEEWLARVFADHEVYDLDPDVLEGQALAAEAEFVLTVNRSSFSARAGQWSADRPWLAIGIWLTLVIGALVGSFASGHRLLTDAEITSGESHRAHEMLIESDFAQRPSENVIISRTKPGAPVNGADGKAVIKDVKAALAANPKLAVDVVGADDPGGEALVSRDRQAMLVTFRVSGGEPSDAYKRIDPIVEDIHAVERRHPGFKVEMFGDATAKRATLDTTDTITGLSELLTAPITLIVLLLALGTVVAAFVPVVLAITCVAGGVAGVAIASTMQPASYLTESVITLVGMALGTDYAFFYLRRVREERSYGRSMREAIGIASATSGRSVVVSGVTVVIAMCGLYLSGSADFRSIGTGTILVTLFAIFGSATVLPAMMTLLGDRIERWRLPFVNPHHDARIGRRDRWSAFLRAVLERPRTAALASLVVLLAFSLPVVNMSILQPGFLDVNPKDSEAVQTFKHIEKAFPGTGTPAIVAIRSENVRSAKIQDAVEELHRRAVASGQMFEPITADTSPDGTVVRMSIPLEGDGTSEPSQRALDTLRDKLIPATVGTVADEVAVTGRTADDRDFVNLTNRRMPVVMGFVILLTFIVMLCTFRSIIVPIKAILCNLLAVGMAYGTLVLVFQEGWGADLINARPNGQVVSWLPLFMFVVLFGLSMDYHVFILSRVRELWGRGADQDRALVVGIAGTTRTVTSAALVMIGVFAVLIPMPTLDMQQLGVGMVVAIAADAFIVRAVFLPASMKLLGDLNWYLPRWLQWLPDIGGHNYSWSEDDWRPELEVPLAMALDFGRLSKVAVDAAPTSIQDLSLDTDNDPDLAVQGAHEA